MKKFLIAIALSLASAVMVNGQGAIKSPAPNPFAPKMAKAAAPALPAYATYIKGNLWSKVIVGDTEYAVGTVAKLASGIYEYQFLPPVKDAGLHIQITRHHMHVKEDEVYSLKVFETLPPAPTAQYSKPYTVDGRRLLVYSVDGNRLQAVAVDNSTGVSSRFDVAAQPGSDVGLGIYDFLVTDDKGGWILHVYVTQRDGITVDFPFSIYQIETAYPGK